MNQRSWLLLVLPLTIWGASASAQNSNEGFPLNKPLTPDQLSDVLMVDYDIDYLEGVVNNFLRGLDRASAEVLRKDEGPFSAKAMLLKELATFGSASAADRKEKYPPAVASLYRGLTHNCTNPTDCVTTIRIDISRSGRVFKCEKRSIENYQLIVSAPIVARARLAFSTTSHIQVGQFIATGVWWRHPPPKDIDIALVNHEVALDDRYSASDKAKEFSYLPEKDFYHTPTGIRVKCGLDDPVIYNQ